MKQKAVIFFCLLFLFLSGLFLTVYAVGQQVLRMSANDPQIQMAEDSAVLLNSGRNPESLLTAGNVDIAVSLAPFLIIYDKTGKPVASSGYLDGAVPVPPDGVFISVAGGREFRNTWQPRGAVRIAAVMLPYNGGFVLAGRSLREVEKREAAVELMAGLAWLASLALLALAWYAKENLNKMSDTIKM